MFAKIKQKMHSLLIQVVNSIFEAQCRIRLKNHEFTILCSNCIGGVISNRLGLQFNSPTVNLFIRQYDFIKFALAPHYYLEQELVFIPVDCPYPVGQLDDIQIHFNHSKNIADACCDWNRRKQRIIWDNLFVILYDRDNLTREQILSLQDVVCKRLIVLTEHDTFCDLPYVYRINRSRKSRDNDQVFLDFDWFGLRTFEKQWDFVKWLNNE